MAASAQGLPSTHERDLREARALLDGEVAVDELAVVEDGHGPMVAAPRDTSHVATHAAPTDPSLTDPHVTSVVTNAGAKMRKFTRVHE